MTQSHNQNPYKILLLDDDIESSILIQGWLAHYAKVKHVSDVIETVELLQKYDWDLLIINSKIALQHNVDIIKIAKQADFIPGVLVVLDSQNTAQISLSLQKHADSVIAMPLNQSVFLEHAISLISVSRKKRQEQKKIILAIGAHPDDIEIGCGGSMCLHSAQSDSLYYLTLSSGEVGGDTKTRIHEAQAAAKKLNAQIFIGDLDDTAISDGTSTIRLIEGIIKQIQPTHVYTHSQHDNHQDHRNAHLASMVACRTIPNVYTYQSPSTTIDFKPTLFVKITDYIEQKLELLSVYKSQQTIRDYLEEDMIRATARYWGRFANYNLVEPMEVIREQYK